MSNRDIGREALSKLVPHAGSMCLLERVTRHSELAIQCAAGSHRDPAHPLRRGGQLAALHLAEYAAQAMAVHGALAASRPGRACWRPCAISGCTPAVSTTSFPIC